MLAFITVVSLSLLAGFLYQCGGRAKTGKWYDFLLNSITRDAGVPVVTTLALVALGHWHWSLILCFGILWGALSSYNKWVGYLFNRPDKSTVYWESWFVTGLFYGLSMLPFVIFTHTGISGFVVRSVVLGIITCLWSEYIGLDWLEESGRGFFIIATIPILFI